MRNFEVRIQNSGTRTGRVDVIPAIWGNSRSMAQYIIQHVWGVNWSLSSFKVDTALDGGTIRGSGAGGTEFVIQDLDFNAEPTELFQYYPKSNSWVVNRNMIYGVAIDP